MAESFVGEIRPFPYNFAPRDWMFCEGQLLSIADNEVLFTLLGTTFGGDGTTTFALPDLRGRVPMGGNGAYPFGSNGGVETVTLTNAQMPAHGHSLLVAGASSTYSPAGNFPGGTSHPAYAPATGETLAADAVGSVGSNGAHENRQPYLTIGFAISLFGIYPSQN